jgi:6-pyruvoyltetrahydropterin/6-carboxytetrahydropterin synthase
MNSYSVSLKKEVVARHHLRIEGAEGTLHSHSYVVEVKVFGPRTDRSGFLIDIRELELVFDSVLSGFNDAILNDDEGFAGAQTTLENFCLVVWRRMRERMAMSSIERMAVAIWESQMASASYEEALGQ